MVFLDKQKIKNNHFNSLYISMLTLGTIQIIKSQKWKIERL